MMIGAALAGLFLGRLSGKFAAEAEMMDQISSTSFFGQVPTSKIQNVVNIVRSYYVDPVDIDSLEDVVIPDILKNLDPHSIYIPVSNVEHVAGELKSNFGGIGITFSLRDDTVNVMSVVSGGPSSALGILPGDKIIKVNGHDFVGKKLTNDMVMDSLRGEIGTHVRVTVLRRPDTHLDFDIMRGLIPLTSVDVSYEIAPGIGYMKIDRFAEKTYEEMMAGIARLRSKGCDKLIVDLRSNSGGYLNVVSAMCNEFLESKQLIVYTEGSHQKRENMRADGTGTCKDMDLVVLIDEYSASASEIFSGAMQDNDRGLIVGRRSFGKGLVQTEMTLPDRSVVRLTVARYHTPSGRCIQRPYADGSDEYYQDAAARFKSGELFNADSMKVDTTQVFKTVKGRTVYGGGGIVPDVFVPYDSATASTYLYKLRAKRLISDFAIEYSGRNRELLNGFTDDELTEYLMKNKFLGDMETYAARHGLKKDGPLEPRERTVIENEVRAYIGQTIKGSAVFYPILNTMDPMIEVALDHWGAKSKY